MAVNIIRISHDNTKLLNSIADDVFDEEINFDYLSKYVNEINHILLVALKNNVIVGQVSSIIHCYIDKPMELYIDNLGVAPLHQRQGIATKLVEHLFIIAKKMGCKKTWVATEPENQQANSFYSSLNFSMQKSFICEGSL